MKWIRRHKKKLLCVLLAVVLLVPIGGYLGFHYLKSRFLRETPNTLRIVGNLRTFPFRWSSQRHSDEYTEPHAAILLPVTVPGVADQLYMQFDTGAPSTFLRSGCLESLRQRGVEFEEFEGPTGARLVRRFEVLVGGNQVILEPARVMRRNIRIEWDKPINVIGSIGADFIDNVVFAIDFPAREIRLFRERPRDLNELGTFSPFEFPGRRVLLPTTINGTQMQVLWDSGCSSFGLITSKYHFENYTNPQADGYRFAANRFGDKVAIHHKPTDLVATYGDTDVPLTRVSYVEMYAGLQSALGRFVDGGFIGNKSLTASTLILDTKEKEFLLVNRSLREP